MSPAAVIATFLEARERARLKEVLCVTSIHTTPCSQPVMKLSSELLSYVFLLGAKAEESRIKVLNESERAEELAKEYDFEDEHLMLSPQPSRANSKRKGCQDLGRTKHIGVWKRRNSRLPIGASTRRKRARDVSSDLNGMGDSSVASRPEKRARVSSEATTGVALCRCGADERLQLDNGDEIIDMLKCTNAGRLPFQILVSHVCQHWRDVAINNPLLWTTIISTNIAPHEVARARLWISRTKGLPLSVYIDVSFAAMRMSVVPEGTVAWKTPSTSVDNDLGLSGGFRNHYRSLEAMDAAKFDGLLIEEIQHAYKCSHYSQMKKGNPNDYALYHFAQFMVALVPYIQRWKSFAVIMSSPLSWYGLQHVLTSEKVAGAGAPVLELLMLKYIEHVKEEPFTSPLHNSDHIPFGGASNLPNLQSVKLMGLCTDYAFLLPTRTETKGSHEKIQNSSSDVLAKVDVQEFDLTWDGVLLSSPKFTQLCTILLSSQNLTTLRLSNWGGPYGARDHFSQAVAGAVIGTLRLPSLRVLYMQSVNPDVMLSIVRMLDVPLLGELYIDTMLWIYSNEDIEALSNFVDYASKPHHGAERSIMAGLKTLRLINFICSDEAIWTMFEALENLTTIELNNYAIPDLALGLIYNPAAEVARYFETYKAKASDSAAMPEWMNERMRRLFNGNPNWFWRKQESASIEELAVFLMKDEVVCPKLDDLVVTGVTAEDLCSMIAYRKTAGAPLKRLRFWRMGRPSKSEIKYMRKRLDRVEMVGGRQTLEGAAAGDRYGAILR